MSKVVDERIVSMRFDNANFQKNVQTTIDTLEKFKDKLKLSDAGKGLSNITKAAKDVDLSPLSSGIETVTAKFSALQVMGITALTNITNSAINATKKMVNAVTFEPVQSGFQEYETQIGAIQTILANTKSKGSTIEDVNNALDKLNKYADMTIYNFTEMTRNIGTFTAAGVDLEKSLTSIKGIANLAAVSGSTSVQASTAMYQLSQALAVGKVSLMDWNSVVNAGMGGEIFQEALKRTARNMGKNVDAMIEKYGSFRESLTSGEWLTTEVLTETLTQLSGAYTKADLLAQGYTEKQANEILDLAETAVSAATEVKTFTGLIDTLKESLQSGWTSTWELLIGDFDQAKALFTGISNFLGDKISASADKRNAIIEGALGEQSKWDEFTKKLNEAGISTKKFQEKLKETAKESGIAIDEIIEKEGSLANAFKNGKLSTGLIIETLKRFSKSVDGGSESTVELTDKLNYFNDAVLKVVRGDFKNGQERVEALTKAGYNQVAVQSLVNHIWERNGKTWDNCTLTAEELTEVLSNMSETELEGLGYTKEQASAIKDLAIQAEQAGTPINELINSLNKRSGRELLIESFKNAAIAVVKPITAVKNAWDEVFPPMTSARLYNLIEALNKFTSNLIISDKNADKLKRTFKGLFALIDIVTTIIGGPLKLALKIFAKLLGLNGSGILTITAYIGDLIVAFRNLLFENSLITKGFDLLVSGIKIAISFFKDLVKSFLEIPLVNDILNKIKNGVKDFYLSCKDAVTDIDKFKSVIKKVVNVAKEMYKAFRDIPIVGEIIDDVKSGISQFYDICKNAVGNVDQIKTAINETVSCFKNLIDTFLQLPQVQSRIEGLKNGMKEFYQVGKDCIKGLLNGLKDGVNSIPNILMDLGRSMLEAIKKVLGIHSPSREMYEIGTYTVEGLVNGIQNGSNSIIDTLKSIGSKILDFFKNLDMGSILALMISSGILYTLKRVADVFDNLTAPLKGVGDVLSATGEVIESAAKPIGKILNNTAKVVKNFAGVLGSLSLSIKANALKSIAIAIAILAGSIFLLSRIEPGALWGAIGAMAALAAILGVLSYAMTKIDIKGFDFAKLSAMIISLSGAILILGLAMKLIGGMEFTSALQGFVGVIGLIGAIAGILAVYGLVTKAGGAKEIEGLGKTLLKMSISLLLLVGVVKLIAKLSPEEIIKGGIALSAFVGVIAALTIISMFGGKNLDKLGNTLIKMILAMYLLVGVVKLVSGMSADEIVKGGIALRGFVVVIGILTLISKLGGKSLKGLGRTIQAISVSLLLLVATVKLLSMLDPNDLQNGIKALGSLVLVIGVLALIVSLAKNSTKMARTIIGISVAIGILAGVTMLIGLIDPEIIRRGLTAIGVLSLFLAGLIFVTKFSQDCAGTITALAVAIGVMAVSIIALSFIDPSRLAVAAVALGAVMAVFALIVKFSGSATESFKSLIVMTAAIALLGGLLVILSNLPVESVIVSTASLIILLGSLFVAMKILSQGVSISPTALISVGLMILVVGALAGILYLLRDLEVGSTLAVSASLSLLLVSLSGCCLLLTAVGAAGPAAIIGVGSLLALVASVGTLIVAIGALTDKFPQMETFLDKGIPILEKIGNALGSFFGNIVGGFLEGATSSLPEVGLNLSKFMINATPFIAGAKLIDESSMNGMKNLAAMIALISGASILESIASFVTGKSSMDTFAETINQFGDAIVTFSNKVKGNIDESAVTAAANAGAMLADMNNSMPKSGGLVQWFTGESDFSKFSDQLVPFAEAIVAFSNTLVQNGGVDEQAVNSAVAVGEMMTGLQKTIPGTSGVVQWFTGEKDFSSFSDQLIPFGEAVVAFSNILTQNGGVDSSAIEAAVNVGKLVASLQENLPESGGVLQWFTGEKDFSKFSEQLKPFGEAVVTFSNTLTKDGGVDPEAAENALKVIEKMINLVKKTDGLKTEGVDTLVSSINKLGEADIKGFTKVYSGESEEVINTGVKIVEGIITGIKNQKQSLLDTIKKLIDDIITAANSKKTDLTNLGESVVKAISESIGKKETNFKDTGKNLIEKIIEGSKAKKNDVNESFKSIASEAAKRIKDKQGEFKEAGSHLVSGFANGINDNSYKALNAAKSMAAKAAEAVRKELDIHSPSRVFYSLGSYSGVGFVNALNDYGTEAYNAGSDVATSARNGLTSAIKQFNDMLNSDISSQPTIKPVLNLDDIRAGAGAINTMFNKSLSLGVSTNVDSISASMNQNGQNRGFGDVVSAINKLRKDLGNVGGNTSYNINGITYDDGSSVSEAVRSLVRAARIERRI